MKFERVTPRGFTLIELLTVIAIVGILAAIIIPVVGKVRDSARSSACLSNLRQLASAALLYSQDNKGRLPPAATSSFNAFFPNFLESYMDSNQGGNVFNGNANAINYCPAGPLNADGGRDPNYGMNEKLTDYVSPENAITVTFRTPGNPSVTTTTTFLGARRTDIVNPSRTILFGDKVASTGNMFLDVRRNPLAANPAPDAMAPRHGGSSTVNVAYVGGNVGSVKVKSLYPEPTGPGNPWTRNNR